VSGELERVSDLEREQAASALCTDLVAGRLTLEEFSDRVGAAYRATFRRELAQLREDLPQEPVMKSRRSPLRLTLAIFGHVVRRGRLRLRRRTVSITAFADLDLDLRDATIDSERVALHLWVLVGNADIYLPEGLEVDVGGTILFGRRRDWGRDSAAAPAPRLSVRAHGLFGTVDVWRVPNGVSGTYSEVIKQMEKRQRQLPA
jgi:hypothetical protein